MTNTNETNRILKSLRSVKTLAAWLFILAFVMLAVALALSGHRGNDGGMLVGGLAICAGLLFFGFAVLIAIQPFIHVEIAKLEANKRDSIRKRNDELTYSEDD